MIVVRSQVIIRPADSLTSRALYSSSAARVVAPETEKARKFVPSVLTELMLAILMSADVPVTNVTLTAVASPVRVVTNDVDVVVASVLERDPMGVTHTQTEPL